MAVQDTNGHPDVYQWEAKGKGDCERSPGCAALISSGRSGEGATFIDASADGSDVFFTTDGSLAGEDPGAVDLYDARAEGGFPQAPKPIACVADACQGLPAPPEDPDPGTLIKSSGNPSPSFETEKAKKKHKKTITKSTVATTEARPKGGEDEGSRRTLLLILLSRASPRPSAQASFGFLPGPEGFEVKALDEEGHEASAAGMHPYALQVKLGFKLKEGGPNTDGDVKDLHLDLPPGLLMNPTTPGLCNAAQFQTPRQSPFEASASGESCPDTSQVGVAEVRSSLGAPRSFGLFNLVPVPGAAAQLGFAPYGRPVVLSTELHGSEGQYNLSLNAEGISQHFDLHGLKITLWGNPWLIQHDSERGNCLNEADPAAYHGSAAVPEPEPNPDPEHVHFEAGTCSVGDPVSFPPDAYLTLPPVCDPMTFTLSAAAWQGGQSDQRALQGAPLSDCAFSPFEPEPIMQLNSERASSPSGVSFGLSVNQFRLLVNYTPTGRLLPNVRAPSPARKAVVALPEGVSINPSVGAGLGVCHPAGYAAETAFSGPGQGCPEDAKIGDFTVKSPLFKDPVTGAMFLAAPHDNPFGSLIAIYLVAKSPERGVLVKVAGELKADPTTGRLTASFDNLPQIPYEELRMNFREGQRSPLATPGSCGTFRAETQFTAWRDPRLIKEGSVPVKVSSGVGGGPCPQGLAPFTPQAKGGTLNARAGAYSPFYLHLTRGDTEQEITSYSATFPTGLLGNVTGIPYCSDAAIEASLHRSGVEEQDNPSCPASTQIGRTTAGYGLGPVLTYAPGRLYLAGPYRGSSFSVVAIDSALVGPFDLGVIVVRSAIRIDPITTQASIDATGTDPIPHIIDGIPIHLRDIRAYIDRPHFTLNPTSCEPSAVSSALNGAGQLFGDLADDTLASGNLFLSGLRLRLAGLSAEDLPLAQGRDPPRQAPSTAGSGQAKARGRQHLLRGGDPSPFALPRARPHQDDLHQGPVRQPQLSQGIGLRPRSRLHPSLGRTNARRCDPALFRSRPPRLGLRPQRPRDRGRRGGADRRGQRRP